ncbi:hypothetical protein DSTSK_16160 [Desulforhabdus sp. TSK]|nr:hypothetical protein DSTSK_16160 [Desulforhabdus sp. TSK]
MLARRYRKAWFRDLILEDCMFNLFKFGTSLPYSFLKNLWTVELPRHWELSVRLGWPGSLEQIVVFHHYTI